MFKEIPQRGFPELDGLRFISVTLVICHHLFFRDSWPLNWLATHGYVGVDIFFTLSGFIITSGLLKEFNRSDSISLKNFWIRRSLRLWPAWLLVLALSAFFVFFLGQKNQEIMNSLTSKWWHYFLHFGNYSHAYIGKLHTLFSHFWSLAVEEHFYLIWPLLFVLGRKKKEVRWIIYFILISLPLLIRLINDFNGAENIINTFSTHTRFDALAIGCLLAEVWNELPEVKSRGKGAILWLIFTVVMLAGLEFKFSEVSLLKQLGFSFRAIASALLIYLVLKVRRGVIRSGLSLPFLSKLGVLSYGAYLYHFMTNTIIFKLMNVLKVDLNQYLILIIANIAVYLPAYISFQTVESYFERMKARFR